MTSGFTLMPVFCTSAAASKTARACISVISGIGDAEAAAAEAEHRVELVQLLDALLDLLDGHAQLLRRGPVCAPSSCGRNSCSGGSRKRMVAGKPFSALKMPAKSSRW